jgi:hypothetical protein
VKSDDRPGIRIATTKENHIELTVLDHQGKLLAGPWRLVEDTGRNDHCQAYRADFNRDGQPDYLVQIWLGGCGLAAGYYKSVFVLSSKQGYTATALTTLFPSPEDFIDLRQDGSCQVIHTSFIYGPSHNYWVYNLLEFSGAELRVANRLLPDFPRWIWYSFRENHNPATDLSSAKRQRLWAAHQTELEIRVIKPLSQSQSKSR